MFDSVKFDNFTLDCDSSVLTCYGGQQGSKRGYNPNKPGRPSHNPIIAFVSDVKLVANLWLRSGNTASSKGVIPFLEDTFENLKEKTIRLLRLDSGFHSNEVFNYLGAKAEPISYIVAARFYTPIQRDVADCQTWLVLDDGVEIIEMRYQGQEWESRAEW